MKILMVCLGNICRSPLAEGVLRHKTARLGLDWEIDSAGTGGWHAGERPDPRSVATARRHGFDISGQQARKLRAADFDRFDHILVMDAQNRQDALRRAQTPAQRAKVALLLDFAWPGEEREVPDPFYGGEAGFEEVFQLLDEACESFLEKSRG